MRYKYNKTYKWSSEIAYIAGLVASDGSLSKDGRHIDFTSKDRQLVELFRDLIKPIASIGLKKSGSGASSYRVQLSDVALYDFLLKSGITPNKSLTINEVSVPDKFFADFLRGFFDGDGSISAVWDKRWKSSYMFYTSFYSASYPFLVWLHSKIYYHLPETGGYLKKLPRVRAQVLRYAKSDSKVIYNFMYYDKNVPHLGRKKRRYLEIFASDPYA